jgi:hypothetical protein
VKIEIQTPSYEQQEIDQSLGFPAPDQRQSSQPGGK